MVTNTKGIIKVLKMVFLSASLWGANNALATGPNPGSDPHRNELGFFDIHVCNWPDRPLFFMVLFSTPHYKNVKRIEVLYPDGKQMTTLDMTRYRVIKPKKGSKKPIKRVFIKQVPVPANATDDWYSARVITNSGKQYGARDFVIIRSMPQPAKLDPSPNSQNIALPKQFSWQQLADATHYRVWIRDLWNDSKMIFESKLLTEPKIVLPKDLLKPGGSYSWSVHARDINEHVLLGDFNHGSRSKHISFSVAE